MAAYAHLLVPTDGSPRSQRATRVAAALAQALGARMTAIHVIPEGVPTLFSGDRLYGSGILGREYRERVKEQAQRILAAVERVADASGVPCKSTWQTAPRPWQAILGCARTRNCDLIVMASHGRGGLQTAMLGSQTAKVLAHSRIPVLVCR